MVDNCGTELFRGALILIGVVLSMKWVSDQMLLLFFARCHVNMIDRSKFAGQMCYYLFILLINLSLIDLAFSVPIVCHCLLPSIYCINAIVYDLFGMGSMDHSEV